MSRLPPITLHATLIPCPEGGFTAICNEIKGAITEGETEEEALENLRDAVEGVLQVNAEMSTQGLGLPRGRTARSIKRAFMELCEAG